MNSNGEFLKVISIDAIEAEEEDPNANKGDEQDTIWRVVLRALNPKVDLVMICKLSI